MRLRRLDLTRYGKFTETSIDFGPRQGGKPDLHVIYGLNEAGKSTALSGYLDLLFGIEERSRYGFLHPYATMEVGAALEFGGKIHDLKRAKQRGNSLRDGRGEVVSEALLGAPLAGLTRDAYRMMFSLDDQTLEDGGNAILESKGDLGELLFSASTGLADLSSTLEAIGTEADAIFRKRASSTQIAGLKHRLAELKARRDAIDVQASAYAKLTTNLKDAAHAYDEAGRERAATRARHDELGRILRAKPLAAEYQRLGIELAPLQDLPRPPGHWSAELPQFMAHDTGLRTRLVGLDQRIARLKEEIAGIPIDELLLALGERLEPLTAAAARYRGAADDLPKRRTRLIALDAQIGTRLRALGRDGEADPEELLVAAPAVGTLRDLIEQRSGIAAAFDAASEELAAAGAALDRARDDVALITARGASDDVGRLAALRATVARLRQGDLSARLRLAEAEIPRLVRRYEEVLAALVPWSGDGAALQALAMPDAAQREAWRGKLAALESRRLVERQRLDDFVRQQSEQEARIAALRGETGAIDDAQAAGLRAERDAAWQRHITILDHSSAARFEERMRAEDVLADLRLARANDLAELRSAAAALAGTRALVERQQALMTDIDVDWLGLRDEMRNQMPAVARFDDAAPLGIGLAWLERWAPLREAALRAYDDWLSARDSVEVARRDALQQQELLAVLLAASGVAVDGLPLEALAELAEAILAGAAERLKAREAAESSFRERERDFVARKRAAERAGATMNVWQGAWATALAATWFDESRGDPAAVRAILDVLVELAADLRERTELHHRAIAMEHDQLAFISELSALFAALGEALDHDAALPAASTLLQRYAQAKQRLDRRQVKEAELEALIAEREALAADMALHEAYKTEILTFLGVLDLIEASQALDQCATRGRLEAARRDLTARIAAEMRTAAINEALERLNGLDNDEVTRDSTELAGRLEDLDERVKLLFAERTRAEDRLNAIGGDDAVAQIEAERRTVLLEIEDLALRFLRLKVGGLVAEHALRAYREKHRSSMMNRASEAFRLITRDVYSGLATRQDKDREALIGLARAGGSKLASDMSKGTRFQLYLALRVAGYEEFAAVRPSVPFITDDIMETFDEPRSEEAFRLFARMAEAGQVIYLTHHRHLCEMARQVAPDVRIHELEP
jgi:uncharacterized protein YhaN